MQMGQSDEGKMGSINWHLVLINPPLCTCMNSSCFSPNTIRRHTEIHSVGLVVNNKDAQGSGDSFLHASVIAS